MARRKSKLDILNTTYSALIGEFKPGDRVVLGEEFDGSQVGLLAPPPEIDDKGTVIESSVYAGLTMIAVRMDKSRSSPWIEPRQLRHIMYEA